MARRDPHSYTDDTQPAVRTLDWRAKVHFDSRTLDAEATLELSRPGPGPLDLDTRELTIEKVEDQAGNPLTYELAAPEPILGSRLRVQLGADTRKVRISYRTAPTASALQWLSPAQTSGGKQPFLFSQCQAIHARSVIPIQDTPGLRITYEAHLQIPKQLRAVMAAGFAGRAEHGELAVEHYRMPQPIPPYLFAFAVGELAFRELGPRTGVWAEPSVVEQAAWEFEGVERMLTAAESLFGRYDWERFDLLTLPPSFPYGGMENPRLTFLTPTLLAGDRSLVNVVAHELAHSWTGNLITNSNAEHFWLNEGWTVFAERKILEVLSGAEDTALHAALGFKALERAVAQFSTHPELTRLRTQLAGIDPDEAFSSVPYEKGYLFLRALEEAAGKERFARFVQTYVSTFRFQSITTEDFIALVERELPGVLSQVKSKAWLEGEGIPDNAPKPKSARLEVLESLRAVIPDDGTVKNWGPTEWQLYLEQMPHPSTAETCAELDRRFALTQSNNPEVVVAWLTLAVSSGYEPALPRVDEVLGKWGRMKYLKPLYRELIKRPETLPRARSLFERYRSGYHPIAQQVVDGLLKHTAIAGD